MVLTLQLFLRLRNFATICLVVNLLVVGVHHSIRTLIIESTNTRNGPKNRGADRAIKDCRQHAEGCHHDGRLHVVRIVCGPTPEFSQHGELLPAVSLRERVNSRDGNSIIFVQMRRLQLQ